MAIRLFIENPNPTSPMIIASSVYFALMLLLSFSGEDMIGIQVLLQVGGMYPAMGFLAWSSIALGGKSIDCGELKGSSHVPPWPASCSS